MYFLPLLDVYENSFAISLGTFNILLSLLSIANHAFNILLSLLFFATVEVRNDLNCSGRYILGEGPEDSCRNGWCRVGRQGRVDGGLVIANSQRFHGQGTAPVDGGLVTWKRIRYLSDRVQLLTDGLCCL